MKPPRTAEPRILAGLTGLALVVQLVPNALGGYGYFIDELYYLACAARLDLGYVDHPPLAPFLLRIVAELLGTSVFAVRLLPAVTGAATVALSAWMAARLGGGAFAQLLTGLCVLTLPVSYVFFDVYSVNGFELFLWTACLAVLIELVRREDPKIWLLFGVLSGVALENKHTIVLLALAAVVGLAVTRERRLLFSRFLLAGGGVAFVLFLPNLWWQIDNGFPSLEFYRNATLAKNLPSPPLKIVADQLLYMNPVLLLVWGAGLASVLLARGSRLRFLGVAYLVLLSILIFGESSRPDRIAGIYPVLLAAGAVFWEGVLVRPAARGALLAVTFVSGLALAPMFLPLLPPDAAIRFVSAIGIDTQFERGEGKRAELPQWLADRFGWEELVTLTRDVVESLPAEERRHASILAPSYGHAGALELLGPDLPPVLSNHNTYFLWSEPLSERLAGGPVVVLGFGTELLDQVYDDVEQVGVYRCDFCMRWRDEMPIYVARSPRLSPQEMSEAWSRFKHYE